MESNYAPVTAHEGPGAFRRHNIHAFPGGMTPVDWLEIPSKVTDWLEAAGSLKARTPNLSEQVAAVHCFFEEVHPFLDGNGRAGRLVLNLLLVRLGYPPAIIYKNQREPYLRSLRRQTEASSEPLESSSPGQCWTTSTSSSSQLSRGPRGWCP